MKEDILKMAVKIARVIDDSAERDIALSRIAQVQAAANRPEDALDTIAYINYADIRVDALLKSLDNMQTRSCLKKESMPQMDSWLEKLMEETMAIPEINVRCPKLNAINLLIRQVARQMGLGGIRIKSRVGKEFRTANMYQCCMVPDMGFDCHCYRRIGYPVNELCHSI